MWGSNFLTLLAAHTPQFRHLPRSHRLYLPVDFRIGHVLEDPVSRGSHPVAAGM